MGEVGGKVGSKPACNGGSLGSNPDISKKINGQHKQRNGQHILARQKNIQKRNFVVGGMQVLYKSSYILFTFFVKCLRTRKLNPAMKS
jgi:hypothetical protein